MKKFNKIFIIPLFIIIPFLGAICQDSSYIPPEINFISPVNGSVLPSGTDSITINGVLVKGSKNIFQLLFNKKRINFDEETLEFTHTIPVDPNTKYQTFYFDVMDKDYFIKTVPLCLSFGEKHIAGQPSVVNNAVRIDLTGDMIDVFENIATEFINNWKFDLFYGWDGYDYSSHDEGSPFKNVSPVLPVVVDGDIPGKIVINQNNFVGGDKQGLLNFGNMQLYLSTQANGQIVADMEISAENDVKPGSSDKALYVQGYHEYEINLGFWKKTVKTNFYVSGNNLNVRGGKVSMVLNEDGKVQTEISFKNANIGINGLKLKYGKVTVPGFLEDVIFNVIKKSISKIDFNIPVFDTKDLTIPIEGVNLIAWPMMDSIFKLSNNNIYIDLGVHAYLDKNSEPINSSLNHFLATTTQPLPEFTPSGNENLILSISDDMANQLGYIIYQSGVINNLDITEMVKKSSRQEANWDLEASVSLGAPPACSFSESDRNFETGKFIVRNIQVDIQNFKIKDKVSVNAIIGLEGQFALKLELNEDGTDIIAGIDFDRSNYDINVLYSSILGSNKVLNGLLNLGDKIIKDLVKKVALDTITFKIPTINLYGSKLEVHLLGSELIDGNLVARVYVESFE